MQGISCKLPVSLDQQDGTYSLNKTPLESIKQNLKMLILTNPGERCMDTEYGVGVKRYLFSQDIQDVRDQLGSAIRQQVSKYLNFITIKEINFSKPNSNDNNVLYMQILYAIPSINATEQLILDLSSN